MQKKRRADFELSKGQRDEALANCTKQLQIWGLTMPSEEPVLRHFGLKDFYNVGEIEFWIVNNMAEGYCGKFIFLFSGQTCPSHHHSLKHETFCVVKGKTSVVVNGKQRELAEGGVLEMKVGSKHSFTAAEPTLILEISNPSVVGDSYFANGRIGTL